MTEAVSGEEYSHFFEVQLDLFNGPIDLLLHLVKSNELPIEKISLAQVTEQYLDAIGQLEQYDLEIAGEYLVIAATLLSIKSSYILNEPVQLVEDADGNLIDPHEELLRRLRDAEVYKDGAQQLGNRCLLGVHVFPPPSKLRQIKAPTETFADHNPLLLGKALKKLLEEIGEEVKLTFTVDSVSIVDRMMGVINQLQENKDGIPFRYLVPDLTSRASIVGTFIALLELCKRQAIRVTQDILFNEIVISLASDKIDTSKFESEFDVTEDDELDITANA